MSESIKATRATVAIGGLTVDAFMLPDGSYRMSQTQASEAVGLSRQNVSDFLRSNAIKTLLGEGYTSPISGDKQIEIGSEDDKRGQSRFNSLPLEIVGAYWLWQSYRGNKKALALCMALITESLELRFDNAFGVVRTESERNDITTAKIKALESDLANLGEGFAIDDDIRRERDFFESLLKQNGIAPYGLPSGERTNTKGEK
jgi:hypothetical protein